jgi:hypothetical protein
VQDKNMLGVQITISSSFLFNSTTKKKTSIATHSPPFATLHYKDNDTTHTLTHTKATDTYQVRFAPFLLGLARACQQPMRRVRHMQP